MKINKLKLLKFFNKFYTIFYYFFNYYMGCGSTKIPKIPFQERTESLIKEGELSSGRTFDNGNKKEDNLNNKNMKNLTKKNNDKLEDSIIIRGKEKKNK